MLLKTIDELKRFVAVDADSKFKLKQSWVLELENTEVGTIAPLLGEPLYAWLLAAYEAPGFNAQGATLAAQLLRAVQAPLARVAMATAVTMHQVSIDETGVHIVSTAEIKTAFQWQSNAMQAVLRSQGQTDLDNLVAWLEAHRDDSAELRAWATSSAGQRHRRELFTCTADFQEYENISQSRAVFEALGPARRRLERFELGRVLSPAFLQELRDQVLTRTLTSDNENLLRTYVYPALASLTIGRAVPELGLRFNDDGIDLTIARIDDSNAKEADAGLDQLLRNKVSQALDDGARYLRDLTDYLDRTASATRFATYFNSPAYTAPGQPEAIAHSPTAKIFKFR